MRMRWLAKVLMLLGLALGSAVGLGMLFGASIPGLPWLVTVGLVKLTLAGALGMIAGGAFLHRIARRVDERERLTGATGGME